MFNVKGGEGSSMLDLGGALYLGGAYDLLLLAFYVWYIIMHSCLFSCIELHTCDCDTYVICDMCALYFDLYICHVTSLYSFALLPRFTPIQMSFISCTHAYFISIEYTILAWVI